MDRSEHYAWGSARYGSRSVGGGTGNVVAGMDS